MKGWIKPVYQIRQCRQYALSISINDDNDYGPTRNLLPHATSTHANFHNKFKNINLRNTCLLRYYKHTFLNQATLSNDGKIVNNTIQVVYL